MFLWLGYEKNRSATAWLGYYGRSLRALPPARRTEHRRGTCPFEAALRAKTRRRTSESLCSRCCRRSCSSCRCCPCASVRQRELQTMRGTGSAVVATPERHCGVVSLAIVLFRQTRRWLNRQGRRSQFFRPNLADKPANLGLGSRIVRAAGCHQLSRQRALDGAVCELRRPCRRRISRCELRRAHSGLLRVGCEQDIDVLLFGVVQLREEGVFSDAGCSEFRQLGLGGCSSDTRLQLALGDDWRCWRWWRWRRQIGEGLVEQAGQWRRVAEGTLALSVRRWRRWRWRWRWEHRMVVHHCRVLQPRREQVGGHGRL